MPRSIKVLAFASLVISLILVISNLVFYRIHKSESRSRSTGIGLYDRAVERNRDCPDVMDSGAIVAQLFQKERYFNSTVAFTYAKRRNVTLTSGERNRVEVCMKSAVVDNGRSQSTFWRIQSLRWTHHTYLNNDSVVVEVGGNVGEDAEKFIELYNTKLVTFELLPTYARMLKKKFGNNRNVKVINRGLGSGNDVRKLRIAGKDGDASSVFAKGDNSDGEWVIILNTTEVFTQLGLGSRSIDLLHINCEGCEFDVLEAITQSNMILNIQNVQFATHFQFRNRINNLTERYCKLQEILKRTHMIGYQYKLLWESWALKK